IYLFSIYFFFISYFFTFPRPLPSSLFPYTTLFRSDFQPDGAVGSTIEERRVDPYLMFSGRGAMFTWEAGLRHEATRSEVAHSARSEEHTSALQSRENLVCRLLLEKKY